MKERRLSPEVYLTASCVLDDVIEFSSRLHSFIRAEIWKYDRIDQEGSYGPTPFHEFVHKPYPVGLGIDYETLWWFLDGATLLLRKSSDRSGKNSASVCEELRVEIDRLQSEAGVAAIDTVEEANITNVSAQENHLPDVIGDLSSLEVTEQMPPIPE